MQIEGKNISRVLIVDDDPAARESFSFSVEELGLDPVKVSSLEDTPMSFVSNNVKPSDAVICDYHLKKRSYSKFDGDLLAAACYKERIPGALCTTFTDVDFTIRRDCLKYIPALLKTNSPEPNALRKALEVCLAEMNGSFLPKRRPWRTLVRIEEVDSNRGLFYAVVSSWDAHKKIRIHFEDIPRVILRQLSPGKRFHAEVNSGAG